MSIAIVFLALVENCATVQTPPSFHGKATKYSEREESNRTQNAQQTKVIFQRADLEETFVISLFTLIDNSYMASWAATDYDNLRRWLTRKGTSIVWDSRRIFLSESCTCHDGDYSPLILKKQCSDLPCSCGKGVYGGGLS